jgi:hypothetical protein
MYCYYVQGKCRVSRIKYTTILRAEASFTVQPWLWKGKELEKQWNWETVSFLLEIQNNSWQM